MQQQQYCYLDIRSSLDVIYVSFDIGIALLLTIYASYTYLTYLRNRIKLRRKNHIIFGLIMCWGAAYIGLYAFGIIIFEKGYVHRGNPHLTTLSKIYSSLDPIAAFCLQSLFLLVPFTILENFYNAADIKGIKVVKSEERFFKFLKYYQLIRIVKLSQSLIIPFNKDPKTLIIIRIVGLHLTVFDALICMVAIIGVICAIKIKSKQIQLIPNSQLKDLYKQLLILSFVCFSRAIFDEMLLVIPLFVDDDNSDCPQQTNSNTIYLSLGQIIMHLIPMYVTSRIMLKSKKNQEQEQNLLKQSIRTG